ncbi:MAG TPA: M48 family metalloprotease [Vicinamibacterales bacterium]|nr:M48 family metalloprotease [Vicinamibacterales bacterium]
MTKTIIFAALLLASPVVDQIGQRLGQLKKVADKVDDLNFSEAEERQLGADISAQLREKYGVVQDRNVHKYVTLVGSVLASSSSRPGLQWTFVVLDTDGVNAFAAPGGFIHVTRGALALIENEAELADVLGHEIGHVTEKHTINAITKSKGVGTVAGATRNEFLKNVANKAYEMTVENAWDRGDENGADKVGLVLASKAGYSPSGMAAFLTRLSDRNKGLKERSGMFASHPEMKARLDDIAKYITSQKLTSTATVAPRYTQSIEYKLVPVDQIAQVAPPTPAAAAKPEEKPSGSGKFGLSGLNPLGREKSGSQTVASAGSRGVNPDRDAKGGPNKSAVVVTVSPTEIAEFRKGIVG